MIPMHNYQLNEISEETKTKLKKFGKRLGKAAALAGTIGAGIKLVSKPTGDITKHIE